MNLFYIFFFTSLFCFISSQPPFTTGFFSNFTTYSGQKMLNWLITQNQDYCLSAYQFLDSQGKQSFQTWDLATLSLYAYGCSANSLNSATITISLPDLYNSSSQNWQFNSTSAIVQLLYNNIVERTQTCYFRGSFSLTPYLGISSVDLLNTQFNFPCYLLLGSTASFTYSPGTIPIYLSISYATVVIQLICSVLLIIWKYTTYINLRRYSFVSLGGMCLFIANRFGNIAGFISTKMFNDMIGVCVLNCVLYLAVFYLFFLTFYKLTQNILFIALCMTLTLGLTAGVIILSFIPLASKQMFLILPAFCFLVQAVYNYILRGTYLKIQFVYYLGLLGVSFIEPLYLFVCPNIFVMPFSLTGVLVWSGIFLLIIVIFVLEYIYLFKPAQMKSQEQMEEKAIELFTDRRDNKLLNNQNDKTNDMDANKSTGQNQNQPVNNDLAVDLKSKALELRYDQIVVKNFKQIPDCTVCYSRIDVVRVSEDGKWKDLVVETQCSHYYHFGCILNYWAKYGRRCCECWKKIEGLEKTSIVKVIQDRT